MTIVISTTITTRFANIFSISCTRPCHLTNHCCFCFILLFAACFFHATFWHYHHQCLSGTSNSWKPQHLYDAHGHTMGEAPFLFSLATAPSTATSLLPPQCHFHFLEPKNALFTFTFGITRKLVRPLSRSQKFSSCTHFFFTSFFLFFVKFLSITKVWLSGHSAPQCHFLEVP